MRLLAFGFSLLLISGCASYGVIDNTPQKTAGDAESYSIRSFGDNPRTGDISLMLAFSGGGTRAAAFAYGVLKELRDTGVVIEGRSLRLTVCSAIRPLKASSRFSSDVMFRENWSGVS